MSTDWRTEVLDRWAGRPVLVLGDVLLDAWLAGDTRRVCREAPVPVVDVAGTRYAPGGAANTAANLAALGAEPTLIASVGDDQPADLLRALLRDAGVRAHLLPVTGRRTMVKNRLLVDGQVTARFDEGDGTALATLDRARLARVVAAALSPGAAVVVCDYAAGTVPDALVELIATARDRLGLLAVDARDLRRWRSTGPDLVTPNLAEAADLLDSQEPARSDRVRWAYERLAAVRAAGAAGTAAITLDADGTVVVDGAGGVHRTRTQPARSVYAAGAGDSYLAGFVAALIGGADTATASQVAQAAASAVLAGEGTGVCSPQAVRTELAAAAPARGRLDGEALAQRVAQARAAGARTVFTNGCFDVLHHGHVGYLAEARQLGDLLIVAVNSDDSVRRLKGPDRPINPVDDRAEVLAALSCVDCVVVFDEDSPADLLRMVRPDIYVKGGDYPPEMIPEAGLVTELGGQVRTLSYLPDRSTSAIIERIRRDAGERDAAPRDADAVPPDELAPLVSRGRGGPGDRRRGRPTP